VQRLSRGTRVAVGDSFDDRSTSLTRLISSLPIAQVKRRDYIASVRGIRLPLS